MGKLGETAPRGHEKRKPKHRGKDTGCLILILGAPLLGAAAAAFSAWGIVHFL